MRRCARDTSADFRREQRISGGPQRSGGGRHRIGAMADRGHHSEGEHDKKHGGGPSSVFAVSKLSSMAQRWPSTRTGVAMSVPAGHQVEKKARSPSAIWRRIRSPASKGRTASLGIR